MHFLAHLFKQLFSSGNFEPHGYCYLWKPGLVWLNVLSDSMIAAAYFAIPIVLLIFIRKRRDLPFSWMFGLFGLFIVACGSTHVMEVWNLWHGNYWLAGAVKALTAVVSVPTALLLTHLMPRALQFPSYGQWINANAELKREIAERREIEVNLRISETIYREQAELLDLTHDALIVRDLDDKILHWNRGAERLYGWTKEDVPGRSPHELLQTQFPHPFTEIMAALLETGYWEGELVHVCRDGSRVTVSSRWALRRDADGKPLSVLESNRDITERNRTEEALQANDEKLRLLMRGVKDYAILMLDTEGRITTWTEAAERIKGYRAEDVIGQHFSRFYTPEGVAQDKPAMGLKIAAAEGRFEDEGWRVKKDGSLFWANVVITPLRDKIGRLRGFGKVTRDITERKRAGEQLERQRNELAKSNAELRAVNKELESFSYSVSHDLRAPLRHIDGFARILKEEHASLLSEEAVRYLDRVLEAANNMGQLIDDLLNLARIGRKEMVRQPVKLDELARQAIADLPPAGSDRQVQWRIEALPEVSCDPGLLKLVLVNLLSNALKFTQTRQLALIEVGTQKFGNVTAFFVRDNGVGFDPQYADKLFGVFQRLHRQEDFPGTGVGLATVQRIVHRHGGEVWAESQPGQGAAFFFTLEPFPQSQGAESVAEVHLEHR